MRGRSRHDARHAKLVPIDREEAIVQVVVLGDVLPGQEGALRHEVQAGTPLPMSNCRPSLAGSPRRNAGLAGSTLHR